MRRSTRFNRPGLSGSSRSALLLNNDGDGSTLTLDFTTGVLDSRLTFTRGSNATFINSSGFVEWSASNHAPRTNWNFTSPTGSGWNAATLSGTGTFQWVGNGTVIAASGSAGQAFTNIATPTGIAEGLRYVMSVTASSVTGSPTIQSIFDFTSASGNTYFKNGAAATAGTTVASGDRISVSAIASSTSMNVRLGCGAWFANRTNESVTLTQFHWHPGSAPVAYYENTGTSPRYDSARFDHDPDTLAPRGLLVEGASTNLLCWSESFATSGGTTNWTYNGNSGATVTETNPAGGSSSFQFRENSGSGPLSQTVTTVSTSPYTYSFWVRASVFNSVTTTQIQVGIFTTAFQTVSISKISGPGSVSGTGLCTVSGLSLTEWTKVQVTTTGNIGATSASVMLYAQTASFELDRSLLIWGAQVEAGSGASSYIPTGASQATRNADECSMTGTNFSSWYTQSQGTLLVAGRTSARYVDSAGFDFPAILTVDSNNHIGAPIWNGVAYGVVRVGGSYRLNYATLATVNNNSAFKTAIAFASADYAGVANGATPATASSGAPPTTLTTLALGTNRAGTANAYFGHVSLVKFWPTRLDNATLQSLTT